jgi:hypothetical protein
MKIFIKKDKHLTILKERVFRKTNFDYLNTTMYSIVNFTAVKHINDDIIKKIRADKLFLNIKSMHSKLAMDYKILLIISHHINNTN